MKRALFILLFLHITSIAHTQITLNDMYLGFFNQEKDSFASQDRWNFDVTSEQWLDKPKGIEQKPYSFGIGLNRMFDFSLTRNHSIAFGIGMHWLNHYNNGDFAPKPVPFDVKTVLSPIPSTIKYSVNKYVLHFIDFNAELRLRFGRERRAKFYMGFRGSYLLGSHLKFKGDGVKYKIYKLPGFTSLNYGPTVRLGLGRMSLYAMYYLLPVYENNSGQKISAVSVGLSFFYL